MNHHVFIYCVSIGLTFLYTTYRSLADKGALIWHSNFVSVVFLFLENLFEFNLFKNRINVYDFWATARLIKVSPCPIFFSTVLDVVPHGRSAEFSPLFLYFIARIYVRETRGRIESISINSIFMMRAACCAKLVDPFSLLLRHPPLW